MKPSIFLVLLVCLLSSGCAGLMMDVKDLDSANSHLTLETGGQAQVTSPNVELVIEDEEQARAFAEALRGHIVRELEENGVTVSKDGTSKISVKITSYEKGCGGCRGFFPFFGLGDSAVDGEASLETPEGTRTLVIKKTGQSRGLSEMGDQTDDNMAYFAGVLVSNLLKKSDKEDDVQ